MCAIDPFCCDVLGFWDSLCAQEATQFDQCQCVMNPPHDLEPCPAPDCPPDEDPVWCVYDVIAVQGDPVLCEKRGIFPGALICVTPCPFPGDLVDCDPEGTGIVTFRTINGCVLDAVPNNGCMPCPPGATKWRRVN